MIALDRIEVVVEGLDHPEGLAFDATGVLWAGGEAGQIYRIDASRKCFEQVASTGGFCLGLAFSPAGELFVCDLKHRALFRCAAKGGVERVLDTVNGMRLETPNSIVFQRDGTMFFSDSGVFHAGNGRIYRVLPDGKPSLFADGFAFANGLAMSADEHWLYVAESNRDCVTRIPVGQDGAPGRREVFASGLARVPDGLAFDAAGNLYVGCYASDNIYVVTADGTVAEFAFDPDATLLARPTNSAFSGTHLYIANLGRWHISRINIGLPGQPLAGTRP